MVSSKVHFSTSQLERSNKRKAMPVFGQKSTYCPVPGTCITVNIPSHGSSNLFFQITSPSTMSYVAFGQGTKMAGSNMFIIYSNLGGQNVTLSPRSSNGHTQPTSNSSSTLTLLAGSGISGGVMTANVLCKSISIAEIPIVNTK